MRLVIHEQKQTIMEKLLGVRDDREWLAPF